MKFAGLNTQVKPHLIRNEETPDGRNELIVRGRLKTRAGFAKNNSVAVGYPIMGLFNLKSDDCNVNFNLYIAGSPGNLYNDKGVLVINDAYVSNDDASYGANDENFGTSEVLYCMGSDRGSATSYACRTFIKQGVTRKRYLHIYGFRGTVSDEGPPGTFTHAMDVFKVVDTWDESTLTWDNQPSAGTKLVDSQEFSIDGNGPGADPYYNYGWQVFDLGADYLNVAAVIIMHDNEVTGGKIWFHSSDYTLDSLVPYFSN